jgi:hypothetical protein
MPLTLKQLLWAVVGFCINFALIYWLVGGSIWLDVFLAGALADIGLLHSSVNKNRQLFDIADAELVRVSTLAYRLEKKIATLESRLTDDELATAYEPSGKRYVGAERLLNQGESSA